MSRIRIGIFFGGSSREREISLAGGRTVYDSLDRSLFEPIPIFVDSLHNFILLQWPYLYKGTIRDFYPQPAASTTDPFSVYIESLAELSTAQQLEHIEQVGQRITPDQFAVHFDIAFLALHGPYGEDGTIQGLLEWYRIPYVGTGILGTAIGIDKIVQKQWMAQAGLAVPAYQTLSQTHWQQAPNKAAILDNLIQELGLPLVVKSPRQGSSLGVSVVSEPSLAVFQQALQRSLFAQEVQANEWQALDPQAKRQWAASLTDLRTGIGFPIRIAEQVFYHPQKLLPYLDHHFQHSTTPLWLESVWGEQDVLVESFVAGREFSCIVLEPENGQPVALSPTEMLTQKDMLDYRGKYLPGIVRKVTPMVLSPNTMQTIRRACETLFKLLHCQVYARIDGFITPAGQVYLNDPNTTAGMNPASFLFHQAAVIGLDPIQLLTFLIHTSLSRWIQAKKAMPPTVDWLKKLTKQIDGQQVT